MGLMKTFLNYFLVKRSISTTIEENIKIVYRLPHNVDFII